MAAKGRACLGPVTVQTAHYLIALPHACSRCMRKGLMLKMRLLCETKRLLQHGNADLKLLAEPMITIAACGKCRRAAQRSFSQHQSHDIWTPFATSTCRGRQTCDEHRMSWGKPIIHAARQATFLSRPRPVETSFFKQFCAPSTGTSRSSPILQPRRTYSPRA